MLVKVVLLPLVCSFFYTATLLAECNDHNHPTALPGRLGGDVCYTEMGKTKIFFYMTPRKDEISRQLIHSINSNNIKITTDVTTPPCPVSEISLMVTKYPEEQHQLIDTPDLNDSKKPVWVDPIGEKIFDAYAKEVTEIAESIFGFTVNGFSKDLSLIANHDAVKIHKDYFSQQYTFLSTLKPPIPKYYLFQDLTLIDWSMAKNCFSGTLLQDRESGDRFLMIMFPGEVFGAVYMEPIVYKGSDVVPTFPGPVAFPFHTALAPIDFFGCCSIGSCKGKRVSATTRGVILEDSVNLAMEKAVFVPLSRPDTTYDDKDYLTRSYPNGILVKSMHTIPPTRLGSCILHPDRENTTILEENSDAHHDIAKFLKNELDIKGDLKSVFHITKQDGGFSRLSHILPKIPDSSTIVIVNRSVLPSGYKHYILAEDHTKKNCPWFQLYWLPQSSVVKIPASEYENFSLTPVEEILFRDEIADRLNTEESVLIQKLTIKVDVYIY